MESRLLWCLAVLVACVSADVAFKNLAGPPSEFTQLPVPIHSADVQNSATFYVDLVPSSDEASNVLKQTLTLTVDSDKEFRFIFYSPHDESVTLSLKNPSGHKVILIGKSTYFPIGDLQVPGKEYKFKKPKHGDYTLTVKSKPLSAEMYSKLSASTEDGYVVLWNEDALATHTALNTYSLLTGSSVGLVSRVFTQAFSIKDMQSGLVPQALKGSVTSAEMMVVFPDGQSINQPMYDDGFHSDGLANDGVYGSTITAAASGQYVFSATLQGKNADGVNYIRTTQQLATVVDATLELLDTSVGVMDSSNTALNIYVAVNAPLGNKYKTYAEVWGTDANGNAVAVAWIGGMALVQDNAGMTSLALSLDLNWLSMAEAKAPLTLKNILIQDTDTFVPVATADEIDVKMTTDLAPVMAKLSLVGKNGEITKQMREGRMPERLNAKRLNATTATIVLIHGYCSAKNPWEHHAADWTNAQFYMNANKNLPHDQFAKNVLDWTESFGAFSYVGHSQGGAVGMHIKNYYWSGIDIVGGGRLVQSVGTPFQGSSGAGSAADLIKLFGVLCGANQDLTKDGSVLWLSGITHPNRAELYYYTTTYVQGKFFGDYCNLATNLVLSWPNDGVTEYEYGQLPGAQNQGNVEGWCHSVDMKYEAQCQNRERNKLMNQLAARTVQ